jgi:hypothetical protein
MMSINSWGLNVVIINRLFHLFFSLSSTLIFIKVVHSETKILHFVLIIRIDCNLGSISFLLFLCWIISPWVIIKNWGLVQCFGLILWSNCWKHIKRLESFFVGSIFGMLLFNRLSLRSPIHINRASIYIYGCRDESSFAISSRISIDIGINILLLIH